MPAHRRACTTVRRNAPRPSSHRGDGRVTAAYVEPPIADDRVLLSVSDAARVLSIGRSTLYQLLASGELPSVCIHSRRLVARDSISAFVQKRTARPAGIGPAVMEVAGDAARSNS